jgi:hypothetical protein
MKNKKGIQNSNGSSKFSIDPIQKAKMELAAFKERLKAYNPEKFGHKKPTTRREFLASGIIPFSVSALAPSLFALRSWAQTLPQCEAGNGGGGGPTCDRPGFVQLHLAGGAMFASQYIVKGEDGGYLANYNRLGLGTTNALIGSGRIFRGFANQATEFYRPRLANNQDSGFITGFLDGIGNDDQIRQRTAAIGLCGTSRDDTAPENNNVDDLDVAGLVESMGCNGQYLPALGQASRTLPTYRDSISRLRVNSLENVRNALNLTGALSQLSTNEQQKVFQMVQGLHANQVRKLAAVDGGQSLAELVYCATGRNLENLTSNTIVVDPRQDAALRNIWGIQANTGEGNQAVVMATLALNNLNCNAGPALFEIGGYDYHDGVRDNGLNKEFEAGQRVGRLIRTAAQLGKKLVVYLSTDGAQSTASPSDSVEATAFNADNGAAGVHLLFIYNPQGVTVTKSQLGFFNDNQVNAPSVISPSPSKLSTAAAVNYGALMGLTNSQIVAMIGNGNINEDIVREMRVIA